MGPFATVQDLVKQISEHGTRDAIASVRQTGISTLSYAAIGERALRLAAGLVTAGLKPGTPVVLFGPNSADWIIVRLALAAMGAIAVAIDDLASDDELAVLIPDCGASHVFAARSHIERLKSLPLLALHVFTLDESVAGSTPHWSRLATGVVSELPKISPADPAMLVYTSGTTGTPKSFMLSHGNLVANINGLLAEKLVGPEDRALLPLPLHHVYPLTVGCLTALASGTTLILPEGVTGPHLVDALRRGRVTVIVGVPRLYAALASGIDARIKARGALAHYLFKVLLRLSVATRRRLGIRVGRVLFRRLHRELAPDLWLLASGGAKFESALIWTLEGLGWEVLSGYGLAETASILTANRRGHARIGSEGTPLPGAEIRIAAPDLEGIGEIEARGPSLFRGYRDSPAANAAAFSPDGWFRTGDLGYRDRDGFLTIAGRVKEMIVLGGGKNIFPEEIEGIYADSPFIRELAVLEKSGALVALVVPNLEAIAAGTSRRIDDVIRVALAERARHLASYQRLAGYAISREPLPRTRLGKYQRFRLPTLYEAARSGVAAPTIELTAADRAFLEKSPAHEIWAWLTARYPNKPLSLDLSPQLDLGIDSLEWVTVTLEIAERFGIQLTEEDAAEIMTLRDLLVRAMARPRMDGRTDASVSLTEAQRNWLAPPGFGARMLGVALSGLNSALVRVLFRLRVFGKERLPADGPYVIACNHLSDLDPLIIAAALGHRRLRGIWWSGDVTRLFETRTGRALARAAQIFPVDERAPATTLAYGEAVLGRSDALVWFPESWRSPDGALQRFLPGIGHLLQRMPVPVIPARIAGTFEAMPRGRKIPRPTAVDITFGPPLDPHALAEQGHGDTAPMRIADALRQAVARLPASRTSPSA